MQKINLFLGYLGQRIDFALNSEPVARHQLAYGAWLLFLISLALPAVYSGPVLNAEATRYPGFVVWLGGGISFILVPAGIIQETSKILMGSELWFGTSTGFLLLYFQLAIHAISNFLLLVAVWVRFEKRAPRLVLYGSTFLALSIVINPVYEIGQDLLVGYYVWVVAHILLCISTFIGGKRKS
ncbi:MAG: hypothetical protein AAF485_15265 [Chloroflexota bacterium]